MSGKSPEWVNDLADPEGRPSIVQLADIITIMRCVGGSGQDRTADSQISRLEVRANKIEDRFFKLVDAAVGDLDFVLVLNGVNEFVQ